MGSYNTSTLVSTCSSFLLLLPSWPLFVLTAPQLTELPLPTILPQHTSLWKNSPLSHMLMNMVLPMTTLRPTSRRPRPRMLRARQQDLSPLLFPMAGSRPPPTLLTTTMDSLLRLPMKVPLSTPQSLQVDTDTLPLLTSPPLLTSLLLKFRSGSAFLF